MDDDKNKPGVIRIPLISDLAFDLSLPLKPPGKRSTPSQSPSRKSGPYLPGYDPSTVDLFEDIFDPIDPIEPVNDDAYDTVEPVLTQEASTRKNALEQHLRAEPSSRAFEQNLRAEPGDELGIILEHLDDRPET